MKRPVTLAVGYRCEQTVPRWVVPFVCGGKETTITMSFYLNLADERQETRYKDICGRETSAALSKHDGIAPEQLHHISRALYS